MPFFYDWTIIFILIGAGIAGIASTKLRATFAKYSAIRVSSGITGAEAARKILDTNGLSNIRIVPIAGSLTDHFDPRNNTISLSQSVINSSSIAAVSVAAHECGHAVQDLQGYAPYNLRTAIVPVVNIGQNIAFPILLLGYFLGSANFLIPLGILLFSSTLIFQLVTLPVEYNASDRAFDLLESSGIITRGEVGASKQVLRAAALTYVAGVAASILSLLRIIIIFGGGRNRD
ncbi:zinc metallopeptidase [Criibacterium bergeronii]|uniref:Zinc metallopeptidase n=1 Tax=Criibacterium bergeronii TaxID=1871336 RepID=A0A552VBY0_9FIRM|nr:zinc metallopeptidase [Criibacterium bergeronii]TRW27994.1 zinc metallopeptidase [Criibacterium bergeronii]